MNVFIIGVAGETGLRLAKLLGGLGDKVTGLYRRPEQLPMLNAVGVRGFYGDVATISDQELGAAALGAEVIVFTAGASFRDGDSMIDAVDGEGVNKAIAAARLAGIRRLLLISVFPEAWRERKMPKSFEHYMTAKKRADVSLARSNLDWVILRPSALTDAPGTGRVRLGPAEFHIDISRDDVAATIASLLHSPVIRKKVLEVTAGDTPILSAVRSLVP